MAYAATDFAATAAAAAVPAAMIAAAGAAASCSLRPTMTGRRKNTPVGATRVRAWRARAHTRTRAHLLQCIVQTLRGSGGHIHTVRRHNLVRVRRQRCSNSSASAGPSCVGRRGEPQRGGAGTSSNREDRRLHLG